MKYNRQTEISLNESELPYVKDYQIHQIKLRLLSNNPDILNAIHESLFHFELPTDHPHPPQIKFGLQVVEAAAIPPPDFPANLKLVSFDEIQKYYSGGKGILYTISPDKFMVTCNLKTLNAIGIISSKHANYRWLIFHQVFYPILAEMLKQLHLFNIHTAAVSHNGAGIMFPAQAKSGKSTITVTMLQAGFDFLSDDICFVKKDSSRLVLLGFPEPIKIWDEFIQLFPELAFLQDQQGCSHFKKSFSVEQVFPNSIQLQATPEFLILPQIIDSPSSQLQPVSKTEALVELVPQSLMVANKNIVKHHLEILTQLVDTCNCFRLKAGRDILSIPQLIKDIL